MIYLDNAATTLKKPTVVCEAVLRAIQTDGNCGRGFGEAALGAAREVYAARSFLCDFFHGTDPNRVVFTANATESLNIAIRGLIRAGDHVITTNLEHNSVLRPLYERERLGAKLTIVSSEKNGRLDPGQIEAAIRPNTKAIVCTHASNLTGMTVDAQAIGRIARAHGILFILDASQTAGVLPIDIQKMGIDILCFTGHKSLFGSQGIGGMYVGERAEIRPLLTGGTGVKSFLKQQPEELPERLEAGTLNVPGIAGLLAGVRWITETGMENIYQKEQSLMMRFLTAVREIDGVRIYGDFEGLSNETSQLEDSVSLPSASLFGADSAQPENLPPTVRMNGRHCPIVSLNIGSLDSAEVSEWLSEEYGIETRPGAHCAPLMHAHFGTQSQGMVRFSFSYFNTEEEVDAAAGAVAQIAGQVRNHEMG